MSINDNDIPKNYICPCQLHSRDLDTEVVVEVNDKIYQCSNCLFLWPAFTPQPLTVCRSCYGTNYNIKTFPEESSVLTCKFCDGKVSKSEIIDHYKKIVSLHNSQGICQLVKSKSSKSSKSGNHICETHNWVYRFNNGKFLKICNVCKFSTNITDETEIIAHGNEFLNCCDQNQTGISAFRYLSCLILQCKQCLTKTVVPSSHIFIKWLSSGKWGVGYAEEPILSITDLLIGDHLVYVRSLYEHHVIVVSVNNSHGTFNQIGYTTPSKKVNVNRSIFEGRIEIVKKRYSVITDQMIVIRYLPLDCFPVGYVIQRAFSRLKDGDYNILTNNCEHIATWCKYGRNECIQLKKKIIKYTKLGQDAVNDNVIVPFKGIYNKLEKAIRDDQSISEIQSSVVSQPESIKTKFKVGVDYMLKGKPMALEEEPRNRKKR